MQKNESTTDDFIKFSQQLEGAESGDALWQMLLTMLSANGIDFVIYVTCDPGQKNIELRTNLNFGHLPDLQHFDPFLKYCCDSYEATKTGLVYIDDYPYLDEGSRAFIYGAAELGFTAGLALPVKTNSGKRYGGFNLGATLSREVFEEKIVPLEKSLRSVLLIAHRKFSELDVISTRVDNPSVDINSELLTLDLTEREKDILYLLCKGHSRKECARFCDLSVHTVSDYVKSLYQKLGVTTRYAAAEKAKSLGLVSSRQIR